MSSEDKILREFLRKLGLDKAEQDIYLALVQYGTLTALELARRAEIPRTSVYRLLDKLKKMGVVEEVVDEKKTKAKAVDVGRMKLLVKQKDAEVKQLKNLFPMVESFLTQYLGMQQPETKVLFYRGREGIRQMAWNNLSARDEIRGYTYRRYADIVGEDFVVEWGLDFLARGLQGRDIYCDEYLESVKDKPSPLDKLFARKNCWQSRYIPSSILSIDHQLDIFNDVVAFYNWHEGEVFGVEIYNRKVARLQKQIFDILWEKAKKTKF